MIYAIGVIVSILTQWLKQHASSKFETLAILFAVSLFAAGVYNTLVAFGYWQAVATLLVTAGAFYAFILQHFESDGTDQTAVVATDNTQG